MHELKSEFGLLRKKYALILTIWSVVCGFGCSLFGLDAIVHYLVIAAVVSTVFINPCLALGFFISSSFLLNSASLQVIMLALILLGFFLKNISMVYSLKKGILFIFGLMIIAISYLLGTESDINTAILMTICLFMVVVLLNNRSFLTVDNIGLCIWGYIVRGVTVLLYLLGQAISGDISFNYGRLSYNGDVKLISVIVAIPIVLLLSVKLDKKRLYSNFDFGKFGYIIVTAFSIVLLLTAARGVLLAVAVSLLGQFLLSKQKQKYIFKILPIAILLIIFITNNLENSSFRLNRIFDSDEFASGNGRTEIWGTYINLILDQGIGRFLFGLGPGEISRISNIGYYAHSTYLDFFFSYGILGFIVMLISELTVLVKTLISKDLPMVALFLLSIIMYTTHGSSADVVLYVLQALIYLKVTGQQKD